MSNTIEKALASTAWPFIEAAKILKRIDGKVPAKGYVLFETGYGPSGLPHIGTFGEVARTTMVRKAFETIAPHIPTRLFCVSDDMDGMRKIPDNVPQREMLAEHLHKPLTSVPDPFGTHESFGHNMNNRLRNFLDTFGFQYEFKSATECYKTGVYNEKLLEILKKFDAVMAVMLPTLGEERQQTYSPFLPVSPKTGKVLQVPTLERNLEKGTITFKDEDGSICEVPVTGGHCKLQWKPDLGMRWACLGVDFEMYGKDHLANAHLYSKICEIAGGKAPEQFMFELFLDDKGEKISKSKGNGLTMDEWLRYAPTTSLAYYMYQNPRKAKRLYFDVIPKAVDEYLTFLGKFPEQSEEEQFNNPVWHIHGGNPPKLESPLTFALLLNLASASHAVDSSILWGFISRYAPGATPENSPHLDELVKYAVVYYQDFVKPTKKYRSPSDKEQKAMADLAAKLRQLPSGNSASDLQNAVFAVGNEHGFENLRDWFQALYEVLLGQSQGPRFGSFIELYGKDETIALIERALKGEDLAA
ncbi:MAG: lysK [Rickettsiaceae bacterium]|jgi:lysyl-tRNA synthetase class 1|nr:lysK [Rickettsiaceae bacterium]